MAEEDRVEPTLEAGAASSAGSSPSANETASPPPPKSNKKLFIIIAVLVVLIGGAVGGYMFMQKSDAEKKIDLCVEVVVYRIGKLKKDEPAQPQIQEYIDQIMVGEKDKIDLILINTFQSAIESLQTSMEYNYKVESPYLRF